MTGEIWWTVAKPLAGPLLKPGVRRAKEAVLGPEHEQALITVLRTTLEIVLDRLPASAGLERHERQHIQTVVERVLGQAVTAGIFDAADATDPTAAAERLLDALTNFPAVDLTTLPVDGAELFAAFVDELPVQLRLAAQRHESPIFEFVTQLQLDAIRQQLDAVLEAVARASLPAAGAREHARRAMQREINRRANDDDLGRQRLVESRALRAFDAYRSRPDWRELCRVLAEGLGDFCRGHRDLSSVAAKIDRLDWRASFESVLQGLRDLDLNWALAELVQLGVQLRAGHHAEAARHCDNAASAARQLRRQTEQPRFEYCLTVVGQWGSGRSRLLLEIARRIASSGDLAVFLEAGGPSPRTELLERAGRLFDSPFATLGQLGRFLAETVKATLVVLIDDADQWAYFHSRFLGDLQELLTEASEFDSLRWVITADEAYFDALNSAERSRVLGAIWVRVDRPWRRTGPQRLATARRPQRQPAARPRHPGGVRAPRGPLGPRRAASRPADVRLRVAPPVQPPPGLAAPGGRCRRRRSGQRAHRCAPDRLRDRVLDQAQAHTHTSPAAAGRTRADRHDRRPAVRRRRPRASTADRDGRHHQRDQQVSGPP